jgi:hypothetical protein
MKRHNNNPRMVRRSEQRQTKPRDEPWDKTLPLGRNPRLGRNLLDGRQSLNLSPCRCEKHAPARGGRPSKGKPWEAAGMSRSEWHRQQATARVAVGVTVAVTISV